MKRVLIALLSTGKPTVGQRFGISCNSWNCAGIVAICVKLSLSHKEKAQFKEHVRIARDNHDRKEWIFRMVKKK